MIDTHAHLDFSEFDQNRTQVLKRANAVNVKQFIIPSVCADGWQKLNALTKQETTCYGAYGLHPWWINKHKKQDLDTLCHYLKHKQTIAVGEIGIDLKEALKDTRQKQIDYFSAQLILAKKHHLPVIIHSYKSVDLITTLLKKHSGIRGVFHAFAGSLQQAEQLLAMGFYFGIDCRITYGGKKRINVVKALPLSALLLESDAPSQPPKGELGNSQPHHLNAIVASIAAIKQCALSDVTAQCDKNAKQLFNLK